MNPFIKLPCLAQIGINHICQKWHICNDLWLPNLASLWILS